jgi:hypothetical protein
VRTEHWKERVAADRGVNEGHVQNVSPRKELFEDLGAADHRDLRSVAGCLERVLDAMGNCAALSHIAAIPGHYNIVPLRQRPSNRLERSPAHHDGLPDRQALEVRQVGRDAPGKLIVAPDHMSGVMSRTKEISGRSSGSSMVRVLSR